MKDKKIDWYERETRQVTLEDIKNLASEKIVDDKAPIVFKNVIGYDKDKDYYYTWEMWVDSDTEQIVISMEPADWHYGKKAKEKEDELQEEYETKEKEDKENE
tara:strand:+ start:368 stop:676 length:309 start_codon:yes stop_codon:yes gene_type:complete